MYHTLIRDCDQPTTVTLSSQAPDPLGLTAAVSARAHQQFGTNFHRIGEARTLGNSLDAGSEDKQLLISAEALKNKYRGNKERRKSQHSFHLVSACRILTEQVFR